jgi:uncharacterized membrane protein YjjP (DUF1212 family)
MTTVGEMIRMSEPIYYYSAQEYTSAVILNILAAIGLVSDSLIIFAFMKKRNLSVSSKFILSFCWADLFLTIVILVFGIKDIFAGGWSTGLSRWLQAKLLKLFENC